MASLTVPLAGPVDLRLTLSVLRHGGGDPTIRIGPADVWRATRTAAGLATVRLRAIDRGSGPTVEAQAWGPGADAALAAVPALVGEGDPWQDFRPSHPVVERLRRRNPGLRLPRTGAVFEALLPAILEQKVTGLEAKRAYRGIVARYGEVAPGPAGPAGMRVPPAPEVLAALPYHALHRFGVERRRADTVRRAAARAARLEQACDLAPSAAARRLMALAGVGAWTAAEVARVAFGDPDAVSVGDYHLPHQVAWALAGERRADDDRMLELLAPFAGHRGRVCRLVELARLGPPRRGPRLPPAPWTRAAAF